MDSIVQGGLALAIRYFLILAAGWLANAGLAVFDSTNGVLTIRIEDAAKALVALVLFGGAILWRLAVKRWGGKT